MPLRLITNRDGSLGGRASLYNDDRKLASAEAHALTDHVTLGVSLDADEPSINVKAAAGPWLSFKIPIPGKLRDRLAALVLRGVPHERYDDADVFEVSFHHGSVWWSIGHTPDSWSSKTPRWRHGSWNLVNALLGETKRTREVLEVREVDVPMPEGTYKWTVEMVEDTTTRPRWPWPKTWHGVEAKAKDGQQIPFPGKGENSYDCEDDAIYALSGEGRTIADGVTKVVGAVLRSRLKYGGTLSFPRVAKVKPPSHALGKSPPAPDGYVFTPLSSGYVDISPPTGLPIMWWPGAPEPERLSEHEPAFRYAAWLSSLVLGTGFADQKTA